MVVDDEAVNLKILSKALKSYGYSDVDLLQDPRKVLERYAEKRPDLILLDLNMPHLDGYEVMKQLKELEDPLLPPIVVLTAQKEQEFILRAFEHGARDYITKPFNMNELAARVSNMLELRFSHWIIHEEKEQLDEKVRERTEELMQTRLQVVQKLGRAAEYRDNETGRHIIRVSQTALLMAQYLGWNEQESETLQHATPMHDIGKIGIPDDILLKPGKLGPEEWDVMKTHTTIGYRILEGGDSELLNLAREIAISHHERWDGGGYPQGLAGEAIPISGRIVSIADVFDALMSKRTYKEAWTPEKAASLIRENGGTQFDPQIVTLFETHLPEMMEIQQRFADAEDEGEGKGRYGREAKGFRREE